MPEVRIPSAYVVPNAVAFGLAGDEASLVTAATPLPVTLSHAADAAPAALTGSTAASIVAGPFEPQPNRPIWARLTGSWTGSVTVQRSTDGGATKLPLTIGGQSWASFTANAQEVVAEESEAGASYYLAITLSAGTLGYRVSQ